MPTAMTTPRQPSSKMLRKSHKAKSATMTKATTSTLLKKVGVESRVTSRWLI